jgi:hypothetical protein
MDPKLLADDWVLKRATLCKFDFPKNSFVIAAQASTFPNIRHVQNTGFAQSASKGAQGCNWLLGEYHGCNWLLGGYTVLGNVIKSPRCAKCGEMMALRLIEPERPGFDLRTFECPKCFGTETLVASISCEVDVPSAPARSRRSGS